MKLPSLNYLISQTKNTFVRFPFSLLSAALAVSVGIYLSEKESDIQNKLPFINLMLCAALGIPFYFCMAVISEKLQAESKLKAGLMTGASLVLLLIFFTLPYSDSTHNISLPYVKYAIYNVTLHLFVSFLPFVFSAQLNGFWQYNKILFLRVWISFVFSAVLFLGLVLALVACDQLFDIHIHDKLYLDVFIVITGLINTWMFLAGIPKELDSLEASNEYPKGLKIFSQYILLPLLALYLVILYLYGGKILIAWNWPKGIVTFLIIYISILGILTFLLLHPYGNQSENAWIKKASKGYYYALFPLLILLFIAIFMRVGDYGITINRYVVILLAVWLTVVCAYTAMGKNNIKFIPASLAVMLLLMSFGPWGMFSVSEAQQVKRLKSILEQNALMVNGKIVNEVIWTRDTLQTVSSDRENCNEGKLNDSLHNEIWSILDYLDDHHGFKSIQNWYVQNLDSIILVKTAGNENNYRLSETSLYMKTLGLKAEKIYEVDQKGFLNYHADIPELKPIADYDYLLAFEENNYRDEQVKISFKLDSLDCTVKFNFETDSSMQVTCGEQTVLLNLSEFIAAKQKEFGNASPEDLPLDQMRLKAVFSHYEFVFEFHALEVKSGDLSHKLQSFSGELYIRRMTELLQK